MCERSADNAFERIAEKLRSASSLLVITHARPDGDGLGSIAAVARAARAAGKAVSLLVPGKIPARYGFLLPGARPAGASDFAELADAAELIVVVDTCAQAQLDGLVEEIRRRREKTVVIDHHATVDDVGALRWVDTSAAASGVMIGELLEALDWPVDVSTAEALMTAAVCDTGWLQFANTDARVLRAAAGWIGAGVRPDVLYRKLFQSDRRERLGLMARVLESLDLHAGGRLAVMTLRREDFEATGALPEETENLINESLRMKTVDTALLLVEGDDGVRVSLRSRELVNVAKLAQRFGGGGHPRAAGMRSDENIDALKPRLVAACVELLDKAP